MSTPSSKKSFFQRLGFKRKKKGGEETERDRGEVTSPQDVASSTKQPEKKALSFSEKDTVCEPLLIDTDNGDGKDMSLLRTIDSPSCFMPDVTVSEFPDMLIYKLALNANKENLKSLVVTYGEDHPEVNLRKMQTAEVYKGLGRMQEAVELLSEVIESSGRSENNAVVLSSAMNELALVYSTLHQHDNAEDLFHKTVKILSLTVEADQAVVWGNIAITLRNSGNVSKAIPMHELAIKMMDSILGKDSPEALFQRGQLALTLKQSEEANDNLKGREMLTQIISQLKSLGYRETHVWIKDFLR